MPCEDIRTVLADFDECEDTPDGASFGTHCLYPSFEAVRIYVAKVGDGYKVHDGSRAYLTSLAHGRDDGVITRSLEAECSRFRLKLAGDAIVADVPSREWLRSAILAVANASSRAAHTAVSKFAAAAEADLVDQISDTLIQTVGKRGFKRDVEIVGRSGGRRHFDFSILRPDGEDILINSVAPHHGSVSHKYVSFADTEGSLDDKLAVFERPLSIDDVALLQQVARIVPIRSLGTLALRGHRVQ